MDSPVRNRRKADRATSFSSSTIEPAWDAVPSQAFTSALPSATVQRRTRSSSNAFPYDDSAVEAWANGWREDPNEEEETLVDSSSRSDSPGRTTGQTIARGLTSLILHPLSSSDSVNESSDEHKIRHKAKRRADSAGSSSTALAKRSSLGSSDLMSSVKGKERMAEEQFDVIVHEASLDPYEFTLPRLSSFQQIVPKDSLAGVALKYGVELADLRKVNKLWSSDSIHLRKVLYIPVESQRWRPTAMGPASLVEPVQQSDTIDESQRTEDPTSGSTGCDRWTPTRSDSSNLHRDQSPHGMAPFSAIRRVPASELSFFPPAAPSSRPAITNGPDLTALFDPSPLPPSTPPRSRPSAIRANSNEGPSDSFPAIFASSLRGLPSFFAVPMPTISSPRISLSSDGTTAADDLEVELDDAFEWRKYHTQVVGLVGRRSVKGKGKLSSIDWAAGVDPPSSTTTARPRPSVNSGYDPLGRPTSAQTIKTQQPTRSPQMMLPKPRPP